MLAVQSSFSNDPRDSWPHWKEALLLEMAGLQRWDNQLRKKLVSARRLGHTYVRSHAYCITRRLFSRIMAKQIIQSIKISKNQMAQRCFPIHPCVLSIHLFHCYSLSLLFHIRPVFFPRIRDIRQQSHSLSHCPLTKRIFILYPQW